MRIEDIENYGRITASALRQGCKIYTGKTHADCFIQEDKGSLIHAEQGFVTESGDFVDREVALIIANYYSQVKHKHPPENILMSEDMLDF